MKKIILSALFIGMFVDTFAQNYLPLNGGTLTGNLNLSGPYPYFSVEPTLWNNNAFYIQAGINPTGSSTGNFTAFLNPTAKGFSFAQQGAVKFLIGTDGNVGIGTSDTRGYKLAVNGAIRSKEVKVETDNWPDFVFKSNYNLLSLTELKKYITQNNHLPDLPSSQEVEAQNGINLGEIVKLQMKKIEELTLYLIEKDMQFKDLKTENLKHQKQIDDLVNELSKLKKRK